MVFDGAFERFPTLRVRWCGWLPDLAHAFHEHWENVSVIEASLSPSLMEFTKLMIQREVANNINLISCKNL